jgi:hypothetical protein
MGEEFRRGKGFIVKHEAVDLIACAHIKIIERQAIRVAIGENQIGAVPEEAREFVLGDIFEADGIYCPGN